MTGDASGTAPPGAGGGAGLRLDGVDLVGPDATGDRPPGACHCRSTGPASRWGPRGRPPQLDRVGPGRRVAGGPGAGRRHPHPPEPRPARPLLRARPRIRASLGRLVEAARRGPVAGPEGRGHRGRRRRRRPWSDGADAGGPRPVAAPLGGRSWSWCWRSRWPWCWPRAPGPSTSAFLGGPGQSIGLLHLSGCAPGPTGQPGTAQLPAGTPAKRSSSSTSTGPSRLRASL